ncbi:hypothetical protein MalM25_23620 [Planctomycetes bacterium MalM25]|nr:hypothetical protein MalM25_23620 [Planctomycetes bacterium MalM25]
MEIDSHNKSPANRPNESCRLRDWLAGGSPVMIGVFAAGSAFVTYSSMYAFRKPFTAAAFDDVTLLGIDYKSVLVASQLAGYALSKVIGVKVIAEMTPTRRAAAILALIAIAWLSLLGFALVPAPYNFPLLFLNGLPLGMVFGLVLSFLEGRNLTDALVAGLCASFIFASGVVKSVGRWLIVAVGVDPYWMPCLTGVIFAPTLLIGVYLLSRIPPPNAEDKVVRCERVPMDRAARHAFFRRHSASLSGLLLVYVALTVLRSLRDDFGLEIWTELGFGSAPSVFATSETLVMVGVVALCGGVTFVRDNRTALLLSIALVLGGLGIVAGAIAGLQAGTIGPYAFMVLAGLGAYVPYVAFHTSIFERLIAAFGERATVGYLMYLADAAGYLAYVGLLFTRPFWLGSGGFLDLYVRLALALTLGSGLLTACLLIRLQRTTFRPHGAKPTQDTTSPAGPA